MGKGGKGRGGGRGVTERESFQLSCNNVKTEDRKQ